MKKLSPKELAALFVEYRELYDQLQEKETIITEQVLLQGETQKIAGVSATFYKESHEVDYQKAAETWVEQKEIPDFELVVNAHSTLKVTTSWKGVAESVNADLEPFVTTRPAHVVVKVK